MANGWITDTLILLPLGGAIFIALAPLPRLAAGLVALAVSLVEIAFWGGALSAFDYAPNQPFVQLQDTTTWFGELGISYHVGFAGFGLWLVGLASIAMTAAIAYATWVRRERARAYFASMLLLTAALVGVFAAQDYLLFYVFWEAMLIPLYVLVGVWGGPGRLRATLMFFIYTMAGSLLMLASIIVLGISHGSFDMIAATGYSNSDWIFLGFVAAFVVKAPLFPFHGWLPDAYREAPAEVAGVLSGVVSKTAAYGFLYVAIVHFPQPTHDFRTPILVLAAIGLIYGSLLAFRAPDIRGVVAYSSLAQMGLITIGLFATNIAGFNGAVLQMVNHGLISAAMFMLAGLVELRTGTGRFDRLGGMARGRPALATVLMTLGVIALAVPGSGAFAGEFLILTGVFTTGWGWSVVGAIAIVLAAMYMLRLISAVLHQSKGSCGRADRTRPASARARLSRAARRLPDLPLGLAGGGHRPHVRPDVPDSRPRPAPMTLASTIQTPSIDWFALSPSLIMLGASAACLLAAVLLPRRSRNLFSAWVTGGAFVGAFVAAALLYDKSPHPQQVIADAIVRDRLGALAALIVLGTGLATVGVSWRMRLRAHRAEYYALLAAAAGGMVFLVTATSLITLFLALEWFSICLYILCAIDGELEVRLEAGLKYLVVGGFGSAFLLFGSALVFGATGQVELLGHRAGDRGAGAHSTTPCSSPASR